MSKPPDLLPHDLVAIPAFRVTATGDPNDNLLGTVAALDPSRGVLVAVHSTPDVDPVDCWFAPAEVTLLERLDDNGAVIWPPKGTTHG